MPNNSKDNTKVKATKVDKKQAEAKRAAEQKAKREAEAKAKAKKEAEAKAKAKKDAEAKAKAKKEAEAKAKAKKEAEAKAKASNSKSKTTEKKTDDKAQKSRKTPMNIKYLGGLLFKKMARGGAENLNSNADEVNNLNVFPVPDGDTGDNMKMTIESGIAAINETESDDLAVVMEALSHGMLLGARGNSGVILSQFFAGIAKGLSTSKKADPATFGKALELGVEQAYSSVMTPTEGTILTVAREAVEYAVSRINPKTTIRSLFADLVQEMHAALDRTPETLSILKEAGVVDSGGAGLVYIMDGFNQVLNGEEVKSSSNAKPQAAPAAALNTTFGADSEMTYGYCTECLLQLQTKKTDIDAYDVEELKSFLVSIGDSVVAFKTGSIVKLHVHTFTPERVLEYCRKLGEFLTIKIENMSVQHTALENKDEKTVPPAPVAQEPAKPAEVAVNNKKYGVVAVSTGEGIEALFTELGADVIVKGGQTHNPSTQEFLAAFEDIHADNIFVFPNNGNIFMAAQQAADLYEKAKVIVVPSKSIGTGYVGLSAMDFDEEDPELVLKAAEKAISNASAGYISPSIRDAEINGVRISKDDTIGVIDKQIVISEPDRMTVAKKLSSMFLELPGKFMLTVFCGADATSEDKSALEAHLNETHPDAEVYFIDGGQEIYPFIFVSE